MVPKRPPTTALTDTVSDGSSSTTGVDVGLFFDGALAEDVTTEDCTLSGGAETTCYSITVAGYPASHDVGPFCPDTITDSADAGGIWFDGDGVYDLDGAVLRRPRRRSTATTTGRCTTRTATSSSPRPPRSSRRPRGPTSTRRCRTTASRVALEWLENGEPITTTVLIPTEPVAADTAAAPQGNQGVTLDGVVIAASAPVDAILGAYTIAAFDDCGAHFNPFDGYHLHGAVGCSEIDEAHRR